MDQTNPQHAIINDLFSPLLPPDPLAPSWALTPYPSLSFNSRKRIGEYEPENQVPVKRPCFPTVRPSDPLLRPPVRVAVTEPRAAIARPISMAASASIAPWLASSAFTTQEIAEMHAALVSPATPPPTLPCFTFATGNRAQMHATPSSQLTQPPLPTSKLMGSSSCALNLQIMRCVAVHADHSTRLALRSTSRSARLATDAELFHHAAVLALQQTAVLTTPTAPFRRLPLDPDNPALPRITVLDILQVRARLPRALPLPTLQAALERTRITLLRAERFKVQPPAHVAVLHVIPPDIEGGQVRADRVIWHPYTGCLLDCLRNLEEGRVAYADLTVVLDRTPSQEGGRVLLEVLGDYLLGTQGRLTVVCGRRYAAVALGVPLALNGVKATAWVRQSLREEGAVGDSGGGEVGAEAAGRFAIVFDLEWRAHALVRERRLPVFVG